MTGKAQLVEPSEESLRVVTDSKEFRRCTDQQKRFVLDFLTTGDAAHAIAAAYPKATVKSRRSLQWQVLRAQAVTDLLEIWKWRDSREALISICRQQLQAAAPGSVSASSFAVQLERLSLGVKGSNKAHFKEPDEPTPHLANGNAVPTLFVGQRVTERGPDGVVHVGIIKALDAAGLPSEVEEVK